MKEQQRSDTEPERRVRILGHLEDHVGVAVERGGAERFTSVVQHVAVVELRAHLSGNAFFPQRMTARNARHDREVVRRR